MESSPVSPVWWPTPAQLRAAASQARRRRWRVVWEIICGLGALAALPLVAGWVWADCLHRHGATWWLAAPVGLIVAWMGSWTAWQLLISSHGRPLQPRDLQEFHLASRPLRALQWKELESILQRHPESLPHARAWLQAQDGKLVLAHLWELRRRHTRFQFCLGVVETNQARDARGRDLDEWHYRHPDARLPTAASMILDGALLARP